MPTTTSPAAATATATDADSDTDTASAAHSLSPTTPLRPGSLAAWQAALRPRSLLVAISPVLVGAALGFQRAGAIDVVAAALALGAALLMQVVTNLQNDVGYTVRGAEHGGGPGSQRIGLPRATAEGWLSVYQVRAGIVLAALLACGLGVALVAWRGWPVLAIGSASLAAALAYMGGPRPIAYTPLGELTVFLFFGLVAVTGTDWVLTGSVGAASALAAVALGCLAAAALAVNNHRDIAHDRAVGRRTFAVIVGARGSQALFAGLLLVAFVLVPLIAWQARSAALLLPVLLLPEAWRLRQALAHGPGGLACNAVLFGSFRLEWRFALLLSTGALLGRLPA